MNSQSTRHDLGRSFLLVIALSFGSPGSLPAADVKQVTELKSVHRQGQTFLTWKESDTPISEDRISFPKYFRTVNELRQKGPKIEYRIYRSLTPIKSIEGMKPIGESGPLSCWHGAFNGNGEPKDTDLVSRYIIVEGEQPLAPGTELYVHNPSGPETFRGYYAVTRVTDGKEDTSLDHGNVLTQAVEEKQGQGVPVLQSSQKAGEFNFVKGPITLRNYIRWEAPPNANRENTPIDVLVALPKNLGEPAPVGLHLHAWGGNIYSGYGWWFNAESGAILISTNQSPYDWWTGYHELNGKEPRSKEAWEKGVVRPYTQRRVLSLLDWAETQWKIDRTRVFTAGNSMGGSGAPMLAIRHPDKIAWAVSWVGVHIPKESPQFKRSYTDVYGDPEWGIKFEDGTPVWDYFDDAKYLRRFPGRETPFITWSNGKNDEAIGWSQAVEFCRAMQETRRPHMFVWGQNGHNQRAVMPVTLDERIMPLDIRTNQSLPAFTRCSLDNAMGNGDPKDGDKQGGVNLYLSWLTKDIVDETSVWEMTTALSNKAPKNECTVDLTPRRLQKFSVKPGDKVKWSNTIGGREVQSGVATVDQHGLVTIEGLRVAKTTNRVKLSK